PLAELAGITTGLAGSALICPRLPSWEATASRRLGYRAAMQAGAVLIASAALVLLPSVGFAPTPSPALDRHEWTAYALGALTPHAASAATIVAVGLVAASRLGPMKGPFV